MPFILHKIKMDVSRVYILSTPKKLLISGKLFFYFFLIVHTSSVDEDTNCSLIVEFGIYNTVIV